MLALREPDLALSAVTSHLNPQSVSQRPQITHLEASRELSLDAVQPSAIIASQSEIIHIDGHNHSDAISSPDIDRVVAWAAPEPQIRESLIELDIPLPRRLLQAIERLLQATDKVLRARRREALRLAHIDLLIQVTVEKCGGDVHRIKLHVLHRSQSNNGAQGVELGHRSKGLGVVKMRLLGKALGHQTSLVALYRTISILLDLEDPPAAHSLPALRQLSQLPSAMLQKRVKLS
jgi:hypothetical protein